MERQAGVRIGYPREVLQSITLNQPTQVHHRYYRTGALPWEYPDECFEVFVAHVTGSSTGFHPNALILPDSRSDHFQDNIALQFEVVQSLVEFHLL